MLFTTFIFALGILQNFVKPDDIDIANLTVVVFRHNKSGNFSNMLLSTRQNWLYATGTNFVFRLNALRIDDVSANVYIEKRIDITRSNSSDSNNHLKYLGARGRDLIVCGTNQGSPHIYDLNESDLAAHVEYNASDLCPGVASFRNLGLLSSHEKIMYSAIWLTEERYGIFRKAIEATNRHDYARTLFSPLWLWEPEFVAMLEDDTYVYVFFTENSIEDFRRAFPSSSSSSSLPTSHYWPTRVSRVARVCKNDRGLKKSQHHHDMWLTFRKSSLQCGSGQGEKLFSVVKSGGNQGKLLSFFQKEPNLTILCELDMSVLRETLGQKKLWNAKNEDSFTCDDVAKMQQQQESSALREDTDELVLFDNDDYDAEEEEETVNNGSSIENHGLKFLAEHTLLDNVLHCEHKLTLPFKTLAVSSDDATIYLLAATDEIIRVTDEYRLMSTKWKLPFDTTEAINQVLVNKMNKILYVATSDAIYQINYATTCLKYKSCRLCLLDPLCTWQEEFNCIARKEEDKESQCREPIAKHVLFRVDESIVLKCDANDQNVKWLKDGQHVTTMDNCHNSTELILLRAKQSHAGMYSCIVANSTISLFNLTMNDHHNETLEKLLDVFALWKSEFHIYQQKLKQYESDCEW